MGLGIEEKVTGEPGTKGMCVAGEVNNIVATLDAAIGGGSGVDCLKLALEAAAKPTLVFNNISGTSYRADTLVALHGGVNDLSSLKGKELMTISVKSPFPIGDAKEGVCEIDSILFSGDTNITLTSTNVHTLNEGRNIFLLDFDNGSFEVIDNTDIRLNPNIDSLSLIDGLNINVFVDDNGKEYVEILNTSGITIVPEDIVVDGDNTSAGIYSDTDGVKRKVRTAAENILLGNGDVNDNASMSVITIPDTMLDTNGNAMGPSEGRELTIDGMTLLFTKTLIYIKEADGVYQFIGDEDGYEYNNINPVIDYDFEATLTSIPSLNVSTNNTVLHFTGDHLAITFNGVETIYPGNTSTNTIVSIPDSGDYIIKGLGIVNFRFLGAKIASIHVEKKDLQTDITNMFGFLYSLTTFTTNPNAFSNVTNMSKAWNKCNKLTSFPLIDTSNVTNMSEAWDGCDKLTSFPAIDTSSVTNMSKAWNKCKKLTSFPAIDTSNVTNMDSTWNECLLLTEFPAINTSNVTNITGCWRLCVSLITFPTIDATKINRMEYAWIGCTSLVCMGGLIRSNGNVSMLSNTVAFNSTPLLQRPNAAEQASIKAGNEWINDVPCGDPSYIYDFIANFTKTTTSTVSGLSFTGTSIELTDEDTGTVTTHTDDTVDIPLSASTTWSIKGKGVTKFRFKYVGITSIHIEKNDLQTDATDMFRDLTSLTTFTANPNAFGSVTNMSYTWYYCSALTSFPLIDTSSVTDMYFTWYSCTGLTSFPLIDTSSVTDMSNTWRYCTGLTSFPLIDTSSVTDMSVAWYDCNSLISFPLLDTSNVTNMSYTWYSCNNLTAFPLIDTSSVTNMYFTWYSCGKLTSFPAIDTSSVVNMNYAWRFCTALTSFPLIDISSVTDMDRAWKNCTSLICMEGFTNNGVAPTSKADAFYKTPALLNPNATEQTSILAGNTWVNPNAC